MADPVAAAAAPPPAPWSFLRRIGAAYTSPRALFEHLADRPSWFAPLALLLVLTVVFIIGLFDPVLLPEQIDRMDQAGKSSPQAIAFLSGPGRIVYPIVGTVFSALYVFAYSGFVLVIGAFLLGGKLNYKQSLSIVTHASLVGLAGVLIKVPLALISKTVQVSVGPGMLFPANQAEGFGGHFLSGFLAGFDVFELWQTALIALGVSVVARVSPGKANLGVWTLFLIAVLVRACFAGLGGMQGH